LQWQDVITIEAVKVDIPFDGDQLRLLFQDAGGRWHFISDDMENWAALEKQLRKRYSDFNWDNLDSAKQHIGTQMSCWRRH